MQQVKAQHVSPGTGYQIGQSIWVPDNSELIGSFLMEMSSPGGNGTTWTYSFWVKCNYPAKDDNKTYLSSSVDSTDYSSLTAWDVGNGMTPAMDNTKWSDKWSMTCHDDNGDYIVIPYDNKWHHMVYQFDSTEGVEQDRLKISLDGILYPWTHGSGSWSGNINHNSTTWIDNPMVHLFCNEEFRSFRTPPSYIAECNFISGQSLGPEHFALESGTKWLPIPYDGDYGASGWHLAFEDADNLGEDSSSNGNDFVQVENVTLDNSVEDSPTNNWCTLDFVDYTDPSYSHGDLTTSGGSTGITFPDADGKWYYEKDGVGVKVDGVVTLTDDAGTYNFGQRTFASPVPAGYRAINSLNTGE